MAEATLPGAAHHILSRADVGDVVVVHQHCRVLDRRTSGAVDQTAIDE